MNTAQRKTILIVGVLLAPALFLAGADTRNPLLALGGPLLSVGVGIYFWLGRS